MVELVATTQQSADAFPVTRGCQVLGTSRATYYRWRAAEPVPDQDLDLRAQIQGIALEMPAYGYRRITYERQRRGLVSNDKQVLRLMRENNLLYHILPA